MNTLIFRTIAPLIVSIMLVFSLYICLRGHNEPGGGFIGGLIAAASIQVLGLALGVPDTRKAMRFDPLVVAGGGVLLAAMSGLLSAFTGSPFMTSIWAYLNFGETTVPLSTPMFFDLGVYLVVFGALTAVGLALASDRDEEDL
ncbi:MnhB domain-containing protein [Devosia rhizoryzae]|uniref:Na(+)/H(+) antiporter subunit B n=1 Tax=Devosia rhizoryzae TaxID=2774137 RepID=A0ABX7C1P6_9HYPH|nr:MnhB domain-containing protein [Devosia rhizoryzae]QQR37986.1 Na(+)/H(+) antiporter subunit B [Devosia rhizoryzae]